MSSILNLTIHNVYSFATIASKVLGNEFSYMRLLAIMDYETARHYEDIDAKHAQINAHLPDVEFSQINTMTWYKFQRPNGEIVVLAREWIQNDSVRLIEEVDIQVNIIGTDAAQIGTIVRQLSVIPKQEIQIRTIERNPPPEDEIPRA